MVFEDRAGLLVDVEDVAKSGLAQRNDNQTIVGFLRDYLSR
jgi:hypothetical protein